MRKLGGRLGIIIVRSNQTNKTIVILKGLREKEVRMITYRR